MRGRPETWALGSAAVVLRCRVRVMWLLLVVAAPAWADDAELAKGLTGVIAGELAKSPALEVLSSADIRRVVELEGDKAAMGCAAESCLAEIANALGARFVVFGELARIEGTYVFSATLYDSEQGRAASRVVRRAKSAAELLDAAPGATRELVGPAVFGLSPDKKRRVLVLDIHPPAPPASKPAPAPSAGGVVHFWMLTLGAGGALAVAGGVYDYLAPTSNNEHFDPEDLIGAGLVGGGLLLGGVGVWMWIDEPSEGG